MVTTNYFGFLLVTKGRLKCKVDDTPIELVEGMSTFAVAGQHVRILETSSDFDSYLHVLSVRLGNMIFVKKGLAIYTELRKNPVHVRSDYAMRLSLDTAALLKDVMEHPQAENFLDICVSLITNNLRLVSPENLWDPEENEMPDNRHEQIMKRFTALLEKFYQRERTVQFYADQLYVTPKYLSACTKHITGHTANWWINSYVLRDATNLLVHSNMSVKTIASRLNFEDQMLFGKYFRRQMGISPTAYKRQEQKRLENTDKK
jgi:AraC-like DNA-binding protein